MSTALLRLGVLAGHAARNSNTNNTVHNAVRGGSQTTRRCLSLAVLRPDNQSANSSSWRQKHQCHRQNLSSASGSGGGGGALSFSRPGQCAVVTGSTSGIGLGIADRLAQGGFNVVLNGFGDEAQIQQTVKALAERHGVEVAYDGADMSEPQQIKRLCEAASERFGGVDVVVNNAGACLFVCLALWSCVCEWVHRCVCVCVFVCVCVCRWSVREGKTRVTIRTCVHAQ